jgi:ribonuclease HI
MEKAKFYVVFKGFKTGIFNTWIECEKQVKGFSGAKYKSFLTFKEAKEALGGFVDKPKTTESKKPSFPTSKSSPKPLKEFSIITKSIAVDGACSGNPGIGEYRCVSTISGEVIFHGKGFFQTTNNLMEFFALVEAIQYVQKKKDNLIIYSDSATAISWVRNKKTNTKLKSSTQNIKTFEQIDIYEQWLATNKVDMSIIHKWDTKSWGEIPADFGRK